MLLQICFDMFSKDGEAKPGQADDGEDEQSADDRAGEGGSEGGEEGEENQADGTRDDRQALGGSFLPVELRLQGFGTEFELAELALPVLLPSDSVLVWCCHGPTSFPKRSFIEHGFSFNLPNAEQTRSESVKQGFSRPLGRGRLGQAEQGPELPGGFGRVSRVVVVGEDEDRHPPGQGTHDLRGFGQFRGAIEDDPFPGGCDTFNPLAISQQANERERAGDRVESACDFLGAGHPGLLGQGESRLMSTEQVDQFGTDPTGVADLNRQGDDLMRPGREEVAKHFEKRGEILELLTVEVAQLEQGTAEFLTKWFDGDDERIDLVLAVSKLLVVGDRARHLQGEPEIIRGPIAPGSDHFWGRRAIEGAIDLDGLEAIGVILQKIAGVETWRVERPCPVWIAPAAATDLDWVSLCAHPFIIVRMICSAMVPRGSIDRSRFFLVSS